MWNNSKLPDISMQLFFLRCADFAKKFGNSAFIVYDKNLLYKRSWKIFSKSLIRIVFET